MKKILYTFLLISPLLFISGCSVTKYEGSMTFPQNIVFDEANFKYVKTIMGSARAVYNGFGFDRVRDSNGLINSAKAQMYETHTFMPNQIITNISRDIIKTSRERWSSAYEVKVIMSADVYEFSNNGVYSSEEKTTLTNDDDQADLGRELTKDYTNGYTSGNLNIYDTGDKLIFTINEIIYKGTVAKKTSSQDWDCMVYSLMAMASNGEWVINDPSEWKRIDKTTITHYKLRQ